MEFMVGEWFSEAGMVLLLGHLYHCKSMIFRKDSPVYFSSLSRRGIRTERPNPRHRQGAGQKQGKAA